jgi:hypothetical protein
MDNLGICSPFILVNVKYNFGIMQDVVDHDSESRMQHCVRHATDQFSSLRLDVT